MNTARGLLMCAVLLVAASAAAQVQTGSIVGVATDPSNAVLPGVTVSLSGERLIGGVQTQVTDATGTYRFDRLPPGAYTVKFELPGFKTVTRDGIQISVAWASPTTTMKPMGVGGGPSGVAAASPERALSPPALTALTW